MKILHISKYYYPFAGGIEQVARDTVNALSKSNEQRVLCYNHNKGELYENIDDVLISRASCLFKIASQSISLSYSRIIKKMFLDFKPEIVILHYPNPFATFFVLRELKKNPKCKLIIYWHTEIYKQKVLKLFFQNQNKRLIKRAYKIIGATPIHLKDSNYNYLFKEKSEIIPYCVNEKKMNLTDKDLLAINEFKNEFKNYTVCFALGRHVPYKGLKYLVEASKYLDDTYKIFIAGVGPQTEKLKSLAKNDKKIIFLGKISDDEVKLYLNGCDIFCFPSITRNECFGLALAEAMYYGKSSITFTIPHSGTNYVSINGETGIEVENGNSREYANSITLLAKNSELRKKYEISAKKRVNDLFTQDRFELNINRLIDNSKIN